MGYSREISEQEIEEGLIVVARLIDCHGDSYWPIFERLEQELEKRKMRRQRLRDKVIKYSKRPVSSRDKRAPSISTA